MRQLTDHTTNPTNEAIRVTVLDEPGHGRASHSYHADWMRSDICTHGGNISPGVAPDSLTIRFQIGPIQKYGVNGVTQEVLLAIVIDRLRCFQSGPFACDENGKALALIEEALGQLKGRTLARQARGVEGTNIV